MPYWDWTPRQRRLVPAVAAIGLVVLVALRFAGIIEPPTIERAWTSHGDPPDTYFDERFDNR